jgi:hypothetical protein
MGTKAIEDALALLDDYGPNTQAGQSLVSARAELEAIRKAAKEWVGVDGQPGPGHMRRLDDLLRAIAKEET